MNFYRLRFFLILFLASGLALGSCQKNDDAQPQTQAVEAQHLTHGSWRLDQILQNGQVTSNGSGIKDRYSLKFRDDGTYLQIMLGTTTTYNGTWMLMSNNTVLHITDHKGDDKQYKLVALTASSLRYSFTNKTNQTEELVFAAQP
ncbi:lipocalin family protein [Hymenobacter arizonensis]|uniref:Lipocalin-like domain-containing protein n=1 Tax=Hymenobacter arizonensis TaxID=1227077 RepID=A0A1I5V1H4_HYMAR|nr:lipocalin family protein [Hymenobacter arizonensis]SFQ01345.1 Lipocalin-like domain-containing protein [Hymenobacter arizonensis]